MKFDERYNHGPRLVFRRVYQVFVGPIPSVHFHRDDVLWQWPTAALVLGLLLLFGALDSPWYLLFAFAPIPIPFIKWQRPVTDSKYHLDRLGIDWLFGPWTLCTHWIDN